MGLKRTSVSQRAHLIFLSQNVPKYEGLANTLGETGQAELTKNLTGLQKTSEAKGSLGLPTGLAGHSACKYNERMLNEIRKISAQTFLFLKKYPALFIICFILGASLDFVLVGVFKVIWFVIYGPAYIAAATGLTNHLQTTKWSEVAYFASATMIIGALFLHVISQGHTREVVYKMEIKSTTPLTFTSPILAQDLLVTSTALSNQLEKNPLKNVSVFIDQTLDYGCIREFTVQSIEDVDVRLDPNANWVWKRNGLQNTPDVRNPGEEDQSLAWCRLRFYRGSR